MDRQTLRDWVIRYNAYGLDGLADQRGDGRPPKLSPEEKGELVADRSRRPGSGGKRHLSFYARRPGADLQGAVRQERVASCASWGCRGKRRDPATRKKTLPRRRPLKRAPALFRKIQHTHRNKRIRLLFQDEARIGQKGRVCRVWWKRGERPPGLCDKRFTFAYIFAAVEPGTDNAFALVLPSVGTEAMQAFLDDFAKTIGPDEHVVMVLDQAGWHGAVALRVPDCITLVPLAPYSPNSILSSGCGST